MLGYAILDHEACMALESAERQIAGALDRVPESDRPNKRRLCGALAAIQDALEEPRVKRKQRRAPRIRRGAASFDFGG